MTKFPITKENEAIKRLNTPNYTKFLIDYFSEKENVDFHEYKGINSQVIKHLTYIVNIRDAVKTQH